MVRGAGPIVWISRQLLLVLAAGFAAALLISHAPGTGVDAQELNFHRDSASIESIREAKQGERSALRNFGGVLHDIAHGTLGTSDAFNVSVADLLRQRAALTTREISIGVGGAWMLAALLIALERICGATMTPLFRCISAVLLLVPTAALASLIGPVRESAACLCVLAIVLGKVHPVGADVLLRCREQRHAAFARANGMSGARVFFFSVLPQAAPELLALFGVSVNIAIGAAIAAEAVCDRPGIGRLAIEAAMQRDPRVIIVLTMLICAVTLLANAKHSASVAMETLR